jgi:DNA-binding beta-propeller fold protein YncE
MGRSGVLEEINRCPARGRNRLKMAGGKHMRVWGLGAVMLLAVLVTGCGGGTTAVGVNIAGPSAPPIAVVVNNSVQFAARATGSSTTTVFWQVCLPGATSTAQPTDCTQGQGPAQCTIPTVSSPLAGYGTITANGLYTAPAKVPTPSNALVVATSCVKPTAFNSIAVTIDSTVRVQVSPSSAFIGPLETYQFTATVTGTSNTAVSWTIDPSEGTISTAGLYGAPAAASGTVTITATSAEDPTQKATAQVSVGSGTGPAIASMTPTTAVQGSVQQDIYLNGSNFLSTQTVLVGGNPVPTTFLRTTLLRATIPAAQLTQAGNYQVRIQMQNGGLSALAPNDLTVFAGRPALAASSPDSVSPSGAGANVGLTGGYFSPSTSVTFDGQSVAATLVSGSTRQLTAAIPSGSLNTPGLYPIAVQNAGVASVSALNLAVTVPNTAATLGPTSSISVGSNPSGVAVDYADGLAVITNTGDGTSNGSVSLIDLTTIPPSVVSTITVGKGPIGVAVDDLLPDPIALVVNSVDQTVSTIDLTTRTVVGTPLSVAIGTGSSGSPAPYSIGINPLTHRAIVAYQSTNVAMILDVANSNPNLTPPCTAPPCPVTTIGGSTSSYGTGPNPAVAVDPGLNWALVTPGGAGTISVVDLGVSQSAGEPLGREPEVVGSLSISTSMQGVGINSETHQALLADPQTGIMRTFSLLDNTVNTVALDTIQKGFNAAAASPLEDIGIAVNGNSTATVVDLENGTVLENFAGLGSNPQAVAIDPVSNQAIVVNQGDNTASILSLASSIKPLQIVEASPQTAYGGPGTGDLPMTILGSGFASGSQVLLDGTAVPIDSVSANGRRIEAHVPGSMLSEVRQYTVQVQNPGNVVSNVTGLTVIRAIPVGNTPVGVAVDTDRDLAVVTNSADGTASLVSLAATSAQSPESLGPVGEIPGSPVLTGANPTGVGVIPRLGLAVVANNGSNDVSVVNVTTGVPTTGSLCGTNCAGATGVAVNQDTAVAAVTSTNAGSSFAPGNVSFLNLTVQPPALMGSPNVDQNPVAVAIDPVLNYAAVATASQASSVEFVNMATGATVQRVAGTGLQNPTGIVFDPINQVFLVANSLLNDIVIIDPNTFIQTPVRVGIAPSSVDYNFQTSTLVTVNGASHTMSVLAYVCPPSAGVPACVGPKVRSVLGLGGTRTSLPVFGPNAVAIDPKLNLAAVVDPDNNRLLLVPLPH